jgi:tetratricopeptide (TPR) repeat protein
LSGLVDKSLVLVNPGKDQEPRYHMLETIRQYADKKLWETGQADVFRRRHLDYFLNLAEKIEPDLRGRQQKLMLDRLEADLDNLHATLQWSFETDNEAELRLSSALMWLWHIRCRRTEGIQWLEQGLSVEAVGRGGQPLPPERAPIRAKALAAAGCLRTMQRDLNQAEPWLDESLAIHRQLGEKGKIGVAFVLYWLGLGAYFRLDFARALALGQEGLALYRETGYEFGTGECLKLVGESLGHEGGDFDQAKVFLLENLALQQKIGDPDGIATAYYALAHLAHQRKDRDSAAALFEQALDHYREVGNRYLVVEACSFLIQIALDKADYPLAIHWSEEALPILKDLSDIEYQIGVGSMRRNLGYITMMKGDYGQAASFFGEAHLILRDMDESSAAGNDIGALIGMARAVWAQGDANQAMKLFDEAFLLATKIGDESASRDIHLLMGLAILAKRDWEQAGAHFKAAFKLFRKDEIPLLVCFLMGCLAVTACVRQQPERAARLFGAAHGQRDEIIHRLSPAEFNVIEDNLASVRAALGEKRFTSAFTAGQALSTEQALAEALEE